MAVLDDNDAQFLGSVLESVFWGIYAVIFVLYLNLPKKASGTRLIYPLSALFILCTTFVAIDLGQTNLTILHSDAPNTDLITSRITVATSLIYAMVDVTSQGVLIYRCWVVWNKNPFLIAIPSILALTSFATELALVVVEGILVSGDQDAPAWFEPMGTASFSISLAVNIIITGLLVLKLVKTHREFQKTVGERYGQGLNLASLISFLIESAMLMFVAQLLWLVLFRLQDTNNGFDAIDGVVTLASGIAPTAVIVRVAMGRSYQDRVTNVVESTINFAAPPKGQTTSVTMATTASKTSNGTRFDPMEKGVY